MVLDPPPSRFMAMAEGLVGLGRDRTVGHGREPAHASRRPVPLRRWGSDHGVPAGARSRRPAAPEPEAADRVGAGRAEPGPAVRLDQTGEPRGRDAAPSPRGLRGSSTPRNPAQQAAQRHEPGGLVVHQVGVLLEDLVAAAPGRVLQLEHGLGVEQMRLALAAPLSRRLSSRRLIGASAPAVARACRAAASAASTSKPPHRPAGKQVLMISWPSPMASKICAPV